MQSDTNEYILIKPEVGLFFPAVDTVRQTICKIATRQGKDRLPIVIDCSRVLRIDYTAHKVNRYNSCVLTHFLNLKTSNFRLTISLIFKNFWHNACYLFQGIENLIKTFDKKAQLLLFLDVNPEILNQLKKITNVDDYQFCNSMSQIIERLFGHRNKLGTEITCPLLFNENEKNNIIRQSIRKLSLYDNIKLCDSDLIKNCKDDNVK